MMSRFSSWQYILFVVITIFSIIYALPNFYPEDPSIQISIKENIAKSYAQSKSISNTNMLDPNNITATIQRITQELANKKLKVKAIKIKDNHSLVIHFFNTETELAATDVLQNLFGEQYSVALHLASSMPNWLSFFGAQPMKLGLDLRGGVRF